MRRFRSRGRFRPRTNFRRARQVVRAVTGITLSKRVNIDKFTIPDVTSADYDNAITLGLVECIEAQDEEVESNGTVIADAPLYSRITSIRLKGFVAGQGGEQIRWILFKSPDADITGQSAIDAWHVSDDTQAARELRKMTIAKGVFRVQPDKLASNFPLFIKRAALARISPLREGDVLRLAIAKDATATNCTITMWGTIYIKANA